MRDALARRVDRLEAIAPSADNGPVAVVFAEPGETAEDAWARQNAGVPFPTQQRLIVIQGVSPTRNEEPEHVA